MSRMCKEVLVDSLGVDSLGAWPDTQGLGVGGQAVLLAGQEAVL